VTFLCNYYYSQFYHPFINRYNIRFLPLLVKFGLVILYINRYNKRFLPLLAKFGLVIL